MKKPFASARSGIISLGIAGFCIMQGLSCLQLCAQDHTLKVWPGGPPGAISDPAYRMEITFTGDSSPRISKVTDPSLEVWLARGENSGGTAVIICPGGGYRRLAIDHEGYQVAAWLNGQGVTAIILTYRLPGDATMEDKSIGPLQDAQEAIRIVRRRSGEWNIDPHRIGIMGFSAGGHIASTASTHFGETVYPPADSISARPDFSVLVYPVISMEEDISHAGSRVNLLGNNPSEDLVDRFSNEKQVGPDTPPAFLVHSADDKSVPPENSIRYLQSLLKYNIPCEMHLYEGGGHGYGLGKREATESSWPLSCLGWLRMNGFLEQ